MLERPASRLTLVGVASAMVSSSCSMLRALLDIPPCST